MNFKVLFLLFMLTGGCLAQQSVPDFTTLADGLEFREVKLSQPRSVIIHQLRCDPKKVKFSILLASDLKEPKRQGATAKEIAEKFDQTAVINSSYFGHSMEILGYAERSGKVLNSEVATDGIFSAFFYWDGGRAGFKRRGESLPKNVPVLFQAGPRLVWDGEKVEGLEGKALANRTALSVDEQGRLTIVVIGALSYTTLADLPEILLKPYDEGGVDSVRALNLDGGKSTQFYLDSERKKLNIPGVAQVPVFLGVKPR